MPGALGVVSALGTIVLAWGVIDLAPWPTLLGAAIACGGKVWLLDRMVRLYEDMKDADPRYRSWLY